MPSVTITILVDNHAGEGFAREHGFSMWIEIGGKHILFDTGQGSAFKENSRALNVDLTKADALILSHGHYDHTGGIPHMLRSAPGLHLYSHPGVLRARYSIKENAPRSIGMSPETAAAIDSFPEGRKHQARAPVMLSDTVGITGPIPRATDFEDTGGPFFLDAEGKQPDPIEDDLALWIQTNQGLVVCLGCCHAGLVNTLTYIRRVSGTEKIRAIIGGLHLINADPRRIAQTIDALRAFSPDLLVPCHCTGDSAIAALRDALGNRLQPGAAGMTFQFQEEIAVAFFPIPGIRLGIRRPDPAKRKPYRKGESHVQSQA